uniref:manganese transport system membrane protein n=1 Tax=Pseudoerythrocladia kornmannii TaxID=753682 RepID=UPI001BF14096|nr:manganese transport system membrane protein [Pseudoerythrocladia kornmannii]QUE28201.1 MntB [Pseudoerythrocladia kornmannii]UNJ16706.1 manganese transport system membrane protein [Pseudoerythrocladia kornmannii]
MLQILTDPLKYNFMQRSILIAILIGLLCSIIGSYLMVQRLALLGDAISHSVMPGLAIAFSLGIPMIIGALGAAILSTLIITWIKTESPLKEDTAIGIVFASFFAIGIIFISIIQKNNKIDLNHFLFGNILSVSIEDVINTSIIFAIVMTITIGLYKELLFFTFDSGGAQVAGLPIKQLNFSLMTLITLTTVASMKVVGVVLVLALLIIPSASAYLLVNRLHQIMTLGAGVGIFSSITGMYVSYYWNVPSGPAIVLVATILFIIALLVHKLKYFLTIQHTNIMEKN